MSERRAENLDSAVLPSDEQLQSVGQGLLIAMRAAIARNQTIGRESFDKWEFEVEGHRALRGNDGLVRGPMLSIHPDNLGSEPQIRSLFIVSTRSSTEEEPDDIVGDIYRISFVKNSEQVTALARGSVSTNALREKKEEASEELIELLENGMDREDFGEALFEILEKPYNKSRQELLMQLDFGACTPQEVSELSELLQRARPTDPVDLLLRKGYY